MWPIDKPTTIRADLYLRYTVFYCSFYAVILNLLILSEVIIVLTIMVLYVFDYRRVWFRNIIYRFDETWMILKSTDSLTYNSLLTWLIDWLIDRQTVRLTDWLTDWVSIPAIIMENFTLFYSAEEDALLSYADIRSFQVGQNFVTLFWWIKRFFCIHSFSVCRF